MKGLTKRLICLIICFSFALSLAACGADGGGEEAAPLGRLTRGYADCGKKHPTPGGDVVLIQVSSLARFALNESVMPALTAFAGGAYSHRDFYAQQGDEEGIYSALTSLYAPLDGVDTSAAYYTLAHLLSENGYGTRAYGAEKDRALFSALGFKDAVCGLDTAEALEETAALEKNGEKDFVFVDVRDLAYPYITEGESGVRLEGGGALNGYLNCAGYADKVLEGFLGSVSEDTTVIIYGTAPRLDEKFPVYGAEHANLFPDGFSYDEAFGVPLIFRGGKERPVTDAAGFATIYDLYPTVAGYLGLKSDKMLVSGQNILCGEIREPRLFAFQGSYKRGSFLTDGVCYLKPEGIASVYDRKTMEQIFDDYSEYETAALETINECEQAVASGYYGGKVGYEELYADMPSVKLLALYGGAAGNTGDAVGGRAYLASTARTYRAASLGGTADGVSVDGGVLRLEDGVESGVYITGVIRLSAFDRLYISPAAEEKGRITVYASFEGENGVYAPWKEVLSSSSEGISGDGTLEADGAENVRLKLELGREDGVSAGILSVTLAPTTEKAESGDVPVTDGPLLEAIEVFAPEEYGTKTYSGAIAVEALVCDALGKKPDPAAAVALCCGGDGDAPREPSSAALAYYAASKGLTAYVDSFGLSDLISALSAPQQIVCKTDDGYVLAVGYDEENVTAILPENGEQTKIPFDEINTREVIIVDSNLYTPEIIESILPENSSIRPGEIVDKKKYIVIHNTGNYGSSATAKAHSDYLLSQTDKPDRQASWHYTVDDKEIYHHLPDNENAWHASDGSYGEGNYYGIGIEVCVNNFPGVYEGEEYERFLQQFMRATKNAAYLVAKLMIENDIGFDGIKQHYDFAPDKKNCPMQMRYTSATGSFTRDEGDMWLYLLSEVEKQYERMGGQK